MKKRNEKTDSSRQCTTDEKMIYIKYSTSKLPKLILF